MLLLLSSFSLLLGRSEQCAWSVTGHRTSFLVLYSGLLSAIVARAGMGALHSGLGLPWLSPPCHPCDEEFRPQSNTGEGGTHAPCGPDATGLCSSAALSCLIFLTVNSVEILFGFFQGKPLL